MQDQSPTAALRLLQRLVEIGPGGRVFTSEEAVEAGMDVGISQGHTYKLLHELVERGLLERPRGRLYVMQPPLGGLMPVRPLAIAVRAVTPAAVSGDTALVHWGLLAQLPLHEEVVSTPQRIRWRSDTIRADGGDHLWTIGGGSIRFRHVLPEQMFGTTSVRLDSETVVPMFDPERTILEVLTRRTSGNADRARELIHEHLSTLDRARLRRYATPLGADALLADILTRPTRRARALAAS
jgi:predicted transcriptional regulator of viral defense system